MNNSEFQAYTKQIEQLVQHATALPDEDARNTAIGLLQSTMDLHGAVMSRIVEVLSTAGDAGRNSLAKLGSDPLICGLLVLYGVHPLSLDDRVARAIEKVGHQIQKQGGSVELLSITDALVRVKIQSLQHGCGSTPDSLKAVVEQAIREAAPEIVEVVVDGVPSSPSGFIPLNMIQPAANEEKNYEESTASH
jgi:Fe-S cluster biogenesis protein NfuA